MSEGALPMLPAPPRPWERARTSAEERGGCSVRFLGMAAILQRGDVMAEALVGNTKQCGCGCGVEIS